MSNHSSDADKTRSFPSERGTGLNAHSSFWYRNFQSFAKFDTPELRESPEYLTKLSEIRRGIANFVRIVTKRDIPVRFSTGQQSYATQREKGEEIVISATSNPAKFDANVGVALHEAAHMILSRKTKGVPDSIPLFEFLPVLKSNDSVLIPQDLIEKAERVAPNMSVNGMVKVILNWLEDRRIDKWMYNRAVGYRPYYDAFYRIYWNKPIIGQKLRDPKTHKQTVRHYLFHVINSTNPDADVTALPGLDEIKALADLPTIERFNQDPKWDTYRDARFPEYREITDGVTGKIQRGQTGRIVYPLTTLPQQVVTAIRIVEIIINNVSNPAPEKKKQVVELAPVEGKTPEVEYGEEPETDDDNDVEFVQPIIDPENLDLPDEIETPTQNDSPDDDQDEEDTDDTDPDTPKSGDGDIPDDSDIADVLQDQDQFLDGDVEKETIDESTEKELNLLEEGDTEITDVSDSVFSGTARVIVYNKFTRNLLSSKTFPFGKNTIDSRSDSAVRKGIVMGNKLAYRLRIMGDESVVKSVRQNSGRLDKRLLSGLGYGDESIFFSSHVESLKPVFVHLTVDASRSMDGVKWEQAMQLAVALAKAAQKIRTLDVAISFRTTHSISDMVYVLIAYDSRTDKFSKIEELFPYLRAHGGTPEGLSFAAIKDQIIKADPLARKFFINLSDGDPQHWWHDKEGNRYEYAMEPAWLHTNKQIKDIVASGISVMSYLIKPEDITKPVYSPIGGHKSFEKLKEAFRIMYGKYAQFVDPENVIDITRTLNKLFLEK